MACEPDHVLFTIPHDLNDLWRAHVDVLTRLLFASVHDTVFELLGDATYLGAMPGIIATWHTWTQTWLLHPQIHCLVTGGGLQASGQGVAMRNGFLLPMRVVMALFRGKLLAGIRQELRRGRLTAPQGKGRPQVENLLNKRGRQKWNVHIRERYPYGHGVLVYLARYLRGGPIANRRLLGCDGEGVVFGYEERAKGPGGQAHQRTMRLPLGQFIGRWRLHVPPPHAVRVRGWGLYAHGQGEALAVCRPQVGQGPVEKPTGVEGPGAGERAGDAQAERCPVCGQPLLGVALVPRAGAPPPAAAEWEHVAGGGGRKRKAGGGPGGDWCGLHGDQRRLC